jgi:hypothetical protein
MASSTATATLVVIALRDLTALPRSSDLVFIGTGISSPP